jgi:hypothetical protein
MLSGKAAKQLFDDRLSKKVVVVDGTLSVNKDKRLELTSDSARPFTDKEKDAPAKGKAKIVGTPCCGKCELELCDDCTLAIKNGARPIVLDGPLATKFAEEGKDAKSATIAGRLYIDKRGLLRVEAVDVKLEKK